MIPPCPGEHLDLDDSNWTDINIVTGCLKLFLRELPDPVIPFRFFRGMIDAARESTGWDQLQLRWDVCLSWENL